MQQAFHFYPQETPPPKVSPFSHTLETKFSITLLLLAKGKKKKKRKTENGENIAT